MKSKSKYAIKVEHMTKRFKLYYDKPNTLKERIVFWNTKKVSENHDKMTDPRTIEFMEQSDHIKYHQQNGY